MPPVKPLPKEVGGSKTLHLQVKEKGERKNTRKNLTSKVLKTDKKIENGRLVRNFIQCAWKKREKRNGKKAWVKRKKKMPREPVKRGGDSEGRGPREGGGGDTSYGARDRTTETVQSGRGSAGCKNLNLIRKREHRKVG